MSAHHLAAPDDGVELSPLGDRRERPVPCSTCLRPTLNYSARCNRCRQEDNNR